MSTFKKKITALFLQFVIDSPLERIMLHKVIPFNRDYFSNILDNE